MVPLADFRKEAESSKPECWVWEARGHHLVLWLGNVLEMMVALNLFAGKVALFALVGRILEVGNDLAVSMGGASQKMEGREDAAGIELLGRVKETEPHQESLDQMLSRTERLGDYRLGGHHLEGVSLWVLTPGLLSSRPVKSSRGRGPGLPCVCVCVSLSLCLCLSLSPELLQLQNSTRELCLDAGCHVIC
jgi:hypothetical protein